MKKKTFLFFLITFLFTSSEVFANPVKQKFQAATLAYSKGDYKRAIQLYEETIEMYPNLAQAYFFLGMSHRGAGTKVKDVIWLFEKAVEVDPNYAKAHETLGKIYYELGEFDKAEKHCLKTLETDSNNISAKLSLGWIYLLGQSKPEDAIPYFESAVESHKPPYAYLGLGMSYFMTDNRAKVLEMITFLRKEGHENLALQLEGMIRGSDISPERSAGTPLFSAPRKSSAIVRDVPPSNYSNMTDNKAVEQMPVRLSGKLPSGKIENQPEKETSAEDRIKALRRRTQKYSKGSTY